MAVHALSVLLLVLYEEETTIVIPMSLLDTILPVVSLFLLRSNNSMMRTSQ